MQPLSCTMTNWWKWNATLSERKSGMPFAGDLVRGDDGGLYRVIETEGTIWTSDGRCQHASVKRLTPFEAAGRIPTNDAVAILNEKEHDS